MGQLGFFTGGLRASDVARKSPAGRKPWDEVVIFKALVLQALYNLSDDRVAFRHLVEERNGLAIGEHAAGHKTAGRRDDLGCDLALLGWPSFNALGIQPPDDRLAPRLRAEE
jgi:hypothetical protein